jgi:hypothetical protein
MTNVFWNITPTKQWPINNGSTGTDRHNHGSAVARGSLPRPSWDIYSLRDRKTQRVLSP